MEKTPSRYFPPSAHDFAREIEQLKSRTEDLQISCGQLLEQIESVTRRQAELVELLAGEQEASARQYEGQEEQLRQIGRQCSELDTKIDAVIGGVSGIYQREFPIDVRFDREYYKDFPVCTSQEAPNFQADFLSLLDGLDEESVETVVLALQRLKRIKSTKEPVIELYSSEEKQMIRNLAEHFYSNILELSDSCWFYRGYMLPVNQFEVCVFWDKCGVPFLEHPERLMDLDIIDAGAFVGDSALILSPLTACNVYAFEPTPSSFELLAETVRLNKLKNIVPCNLALGEEPDAISISPSINFNGSCSTQFENAAFDYAETIEVKSTTIDDFVKEHDLHVGLIKADVEGAEQLLLRGAMETIKSQKPALLISIYHNASDFFHIKPMLEALDLGYKFKIRHSVGGSVMTETVLIAEVV